jgi:hypothetical protein
MNVNGGLSGGESAGGGKGDGKDTEGEENESMLHKYIYNETHHLKNREEKGRRKKYNREVEFVQSTLYAYMELSQ